MLHAGRAPIRCRTIWGLQHLKGHGIIYTIIAFFLVLTLINHILNNTLQSLSVFLTRMNQERR